jgi:type IV secretion system protein VirD4
MSSLQQQRSLKSMHYGATRTQSPLARSLASTMWDMVNETFSGALGNATEDTEWIASAAYGDLVSGHLTNGPLYRIAELAEGNLVVFCSIRCPAFSSRLAQQFN